MDKLRQTTHHWLRKSERIFKTDMVYLAKGGFWLGLQQIVTVLISLLLTLGFANLISKETYGLYRFILSGIGILSIPALSGLNSALTQAIARGKEEVIEPVFATKLKWGLLSGGAAILTAGYYFLKNNEGLATAFIIIALLLPLMNAYGVYDSILEGRKAFRQSAQYTIVSQIVAAIALFAAMFFSGNFLIIITVYITSWTILRFIWFTQTKREENHNVSTEETRRTITFGKHLSAIDILASISSYLDKILVFHFVGATGLAIYSLATAPLEQSRVIGKNLAKLAFPKFSKRSIAEINTTIYRRLALLVLAGAVAFGGYILVAPYLYGFLFPNYLEAIPFSKMYAIVLFFSPSSQLLGAMFISQPSLIKSVYTSNTLTSVALITLLGLLGYLFGIMGIILARVIYTALNFFIGIVLWNRAHRINNQS